MLRYLITLLVSTLMLSATASGAPSVSMLSTPESAGMYEKAVVTFNVTTVATNYYWPYDPSPAANTSEHPNAVPAGVGVSVDGLFLPPNESDWANAVVQPAFYYQDFTRNDTYIANRTWLYPNGSPHWMLRFAPTSLGTWRYKIRVTDSSGTFTSPEHSFTCESSSNHGFVRVSPTDGRYFELSDGTYLPMIGRNLDLGSLATMETVYQADGNEGINLIRCWWQSSQSLPLYGAGGQGGDNVWHHAAYSAAEVVPGRIASALVPNASGTFDSLYTQPMCKPSTTYRLSALVKTVGITGDGDYGVRLDASSTIGHSYSARLTGDSDWRTISVDFQTQSSWRTATCALGMQNVTGGVAYCAEMSLKESLGNGQYGPELITNRRDFQAHASYAQDVAWKIDRQLEIARQNGIYIKAVLEEKQDSFLSRIAADGSLGASADNNMYASATHACRTFQKYHWRYVIARWGYSTALHSVEFCNEGDPNSGVHSEAVSALGAYFQANDPNGHLASTSNWHSVAAEMMRAPNVGMADLHMYMGWNVASGGNRLIPGWDGSWSFKNTISDPANLGDGFAWDTTVKHSGDRSLKVTLPPYTGTNTEVASNLRFQFPVRYGDQIRLSAWVKGNNVIPYASGSGSANQSKLGIQYTRYGGDFVAYPWGFSEAPKAPQAVGTPTYDWQQIEKTWTVTTANANLAEFSINRRTNGSADQGAEVWWDDIVIENLTTGQVVNYNGGFEYIEPESYDVVAGHCAYSQIMHGFAYGKPVLRGEVGINHPLRFTDPYNGFSFTEEDQALIDDVNGIWWKKLVWAHTEPHGLIEMYWWQDILSARSFTYAKAYQNFMADIPLSNGHYVDASATTSNTGLRVLGQKDLTHNKAHLWIDNPKHTWKNVVDGVAIPAASGTVMVTGFSDGPYKAEWWDTSTGLITSTEPKTCTGGVITLDVSNLSTDKACKIYRNDASPPSGSITINGGAASTSSTEVTLQLSATDADSGVSMMRLSNDGSTWGAWISYATSKQWTLAGGDGQKTVYVEYMNDGGITSSIYSDSIILDTGQPTGTISINSGAAYTGSQAVVLALSTSDANEVEQMRFSNDGTTWSAWESYATGKGWMLTPGSGTKTVRVQFMDIAANVSPTYSDSIVLDTTPPTGSIVVNGGAQYAGSASVTLTLSASDSGSGVGQMRFSNDGTAWSAWESYATSKAWLLLSGDGAKTVRVQYKDKVGQISAAYSDGITLDGTVPTGSITINAGATYTNKPSVTLTLSATDASSGLYRMRFSNDGTTWSAWESYATSKAWTLPTGDGTKTVRVQYKDVAGNISATCSDTIDLREAMPAGSITIEAGAEYAGKTSVTLSLDDNGGDAVQMRISNDGTTWNAWELYATSKSWTLTSGDGSKTVYAQFRNDQNAVSPTASDDILLDTTKPAGTITVNNGAQYTNSVSVTVGIVSVSDACSGVHQMRFSNSGTSWSTWEAYTGTKSWSVTTGSGSKTVYAQFRDAVGNISSSATDAITLDTDPPTGSININSGATYTASTSVALSLSAADGRSGVAQLRLSNNGTTWTAWENYSSTKPWTLSSGDGTKTVYVQYKDGATNVSTSYSDTIVLAANGPSGSITINGGDEYVGSTTVTLTLSATGGAAAVSHMRFSNNGTAWTSWETYRTSRSWTLSTGDGTKTVYAEFKSAAGSTSETCSDAIALKTSDPTIAFTTPSSDAQYDCNHPSLAIAGTSAGGVIGLSWAVEGGATGDCTGTISWTTGAIPLAEGDNVVTVTAWDAVGSTATRTINLHRVDVHPPTDWASSMMVSVPIVPDQPDPKVGLGFDANGWCIFRPTSNDYVIYGNDPQHLTWFSPAASTPGRGFWARFSTAAKAPLGRIPRQDQPVTIRLYPGWNLVGNPFISPVPWDLTRIMVREAGGTARTLQNSRSVVEDFAYGWRRNGDTAAYYVVYDSNLSPGVDDTLDPWMGYWIKAYRECDFIIPAPPYNP